MKKLILGFLALASLSTLASSPGVGSFSLYQVSGGVVSGSYTIEISAYDSAKKNYTQTYTTYINGNRSVDKVVLPEDQVNTKEENALLVDLCETDDVRGEFRVVKVPAGTFDACKLTSEDGQVIYMAAAPFGFVKLVTPNGNLFELEDYKF